MLSLNSKVSLASSSSAVSLEYEALSMGHPPDEVCKDVLTGHKRRVLSLDHVNYMNIGKRNKNKSLMRSD